MFIHTFRRKVLCVTINLKPEIMRAFYLIGCLILLASPVFSQRQILWKMGENDGSPQGMALQPHDYARFVEFDFGYEDRFFLAGYSKTTEEWPYVLPGTADSWGGTGPTSGIRSHFLNVYFDIKKKETGGNRSEEHKSELQSLLRTSYAVSCLKKKKKKYNKN